MRNPAYKKIFISYRVQDTAGETGRLVDALKQYFLDEQIFLDIENLEPGVDFTEAIEHSLDACDVFLAVIGPEWAGRRSSGGLRIQEPDDWVRLEVSTALQRGIRVVPVLVDNGAMPPADQLPDDLQPMLRRQAIEISNKRWQYDTNQLIKFLVEKAGIPPLKKRGPAPPPRPGGNSRKTWTYVGVGFGMAFTVLILIGVLMQQENEPVSPYRPPEDSTKVPLGPEKPPAVAGLRADNVNGRWDEVDEGITSTLVLRQNGNELTVSVEMSGQVLTTGTGTIQNKNVNLNFNLLGMPTTLKAVLTDNNTMKGTYYMASSGDEQAITLVRNGE
jgi:hypothetical protein